MLPWAAVFSASCCTPHPSSHLTGVTMNKLTVLLAVTLAAASAPGVAGHHEKPDMHNMMKMMDTNNDGMISRDEFMKAHESMYDKMKKNAAGMVDMKEMEMTMRKRMDMHHKSMPMDRHDMKKQDGMAK
jgi:hypothetical protein